MVLARAARNKTNVRISRHVVLYILLIALLYYYIFRLAFLSKNYFQVQVQVPDFAVVPVPFDEVYSLNKEATHSENKR